MVLFKGLTVALRIKGIPLEEHLDPHGEQDDEQRCVRYVVAQPGAEFDVHASMIAPADKRRKDIWQVMVYADGKCMGGRYIHTAYETYTMIEGRESFDGRIHTLNRFIFNPITIVEAAPHASKQKLAETAQEFAEIRVEWDRVKSLEPVKPLHRNVDSRENTISNKLLKGRAISCNTGFAPAQEIPSVSYVEPTLYDKTPFATFVLRYRTKEDLQKELIIPRSPSPIPLEQRRVEDLSVEEARMLVQMLRAEKNVAVKREQASQKKHLSKRSRSATEDEDETGDEDEGEVVAVPNPSKKTKSGPTIDLI